MLIRQFTVPLEGVSLTPLALDYGRKFKYVAAEYPDQVAATLLLLQPTWTSVVNGFLHPQTYTVVARRAPDNTWGANKWAVTMGKIEEKDVSLEDPSLGHAISTASLREAREEVMSDDGGGLPVIAGSYLDSSTGKLIHIVVHELGDSREGLGELSFDVLDQNEHSEIAFIELLKLATLEAMTPEVKFLFLSAFRFILEQNQRLQQALRLREIPSAGV